MALAGGTSELPPSLVPTPRRGPAPDLTGYASRLLTGKTILITTKMDGYGLFLTDPLRSFQGYAAGTGLYVSGVIYCFNGVQIEMVSDFLVIIRKWK